MNEVSPPAPGRGPERSLLLIGGLAALLIVVTIVVAFVLGDREAATFDPSSPQRAVQDYLQAVSDGDFGAAYALMSAEYRRATSLAEFTSRAQYSTSTNARQVTVDKVDVEGNTARIRLQIRYDDVDGYGGRADALLINEGGAWHLRSPVS